MSKTKVRLSLESSVKARFKVTILSLSVLFISNLPGQEKRDPKLQQVYQQMDTRAKTFRSFTATIKRKKYTAVLGDFDTPEIGELCYKHAKNGTVLLRLEFTSPGKQILTIKKGVATVYQPDINQAQIKDLGKDQQIAEYLAIGLGQSPAKLEKTFDISYKGGETINGSSCDVLVFKPKLPQIATYFSSMTVWYKQSDGIPIQNKMEEPSGDYVISTFSEEKLNINIPESKFDQNLPSGVQKLQY